MMYSEFITGTGCKDNEHNYNVYKDLEKLYMESDISKADVYEFGKKLVDNSKSEEEIRIENEIKAELQKWEEEKTYYTREVERFENILSVEDDTNWIKEWKANIKRCKEEIKTANRRIKELKWVLA